MKRHLKVDASPWAAKLTDFDVLKKVLSSPYGEKVREDKTNRTKKKAGNIKGERSLGINRDESFRD